MPAEPFGQPARLVRVAADDGRELPPGAISPVAGSYRSPEGATPSTVASRALRRSDSTRTARWADGREKEYAIAISSKCRSGNSIRVAAL